MTGVPRSMADRLAVVSEIRESRAIGSLFCAGVGGLDGLDGLDEDATEVAYGVYGVYGVYGGSSTLLISDRISVVPPSSP